VRVLHTIASIAAVNGGPSAVVRTLARAQSELGIEVEVIAVAEREPRDHGVGVFTDGGVVFRTFSRQTTFYTVSTALTRWLWSHAQTFDVIHVHGLFNYPAVAACWCAQKASTPFIVRPAGSLARWSMANRRRRLKRLSYSLLESPLLRRAAAVQFTSQQELAEALDLGVANGVVIPNPVDVSRSSSPSGTFRARHGLQDKTIVVSLSRVDPKKGFDLLLPAFAELRRHTETALVIAGSGPEHYVDEVRARTAALGLTNDVIWTGFLGDEEKRAVLADADLFVLPSYSENFGVAVVEAMAAGVPVIVSDQVGLRDLVAQSGAGLIVRCAVEPLVQALQHAVHNREWRLAAGVAARAAAATFEPTSIARQLAALYKEVQDARHFASSALPPKVSPERV